MPNQHFRKADPDLRIENIWIGLTLYNCTMYNLYFDIFASLVLLNPTLRILPILL